MQTPVSIRRLARRLPWSAAVLACAVLAAAGCKSGVAGNRAGGGLASRGDPLLGHRIPPQNLPVPARDLAGDRRDPLLGFPTGDPKRGDRASTPDGSGKSAALPPRRTSEPYRPTRATTNAALTAPLRPDDSDLSIGDRRTPGTAAIRGPVPFRTAEAGTSFDQIVAELRRYGAKLGEPEREDGQFVVRGEVPLDPAQPGRMRWYEGVGPTAAAAAKQVLEQVKSDKAQ